MLAPAAIPTTPDNHRLDCIDSRFMDDFWKATGQALEVFSRSIFGAKTGKGFVPLNIAAQLAKSPLLSKHGISVTSCTHLLDGVEQKYPYQSDLTDESHFSGLDIGQSGQRFIASFRVSEYECTGGESYCAVDIIVYIDPDGLIKATPIVTKAIVGGFGGPGTLQSATLARFNKLKDMDEAGIPIAHIHGVNPKKAVIYERLYCGDKEAVFNLIKSDDNAALKYLPQLAKIAKILDSSGYHSLNFLSDLVFDGENFLFLDGGSDVGNKGDLKKGETPSYDLLIRTFPQYSGHIESMHADGDGVMQNVSDLIRTEVDKSTAL